jgi:dephospho-CoA kinase
VRRAIAERLGESVLDGGGEIDRDAVGKVVFADSASLRWLEELLHPLVVATYLRWRDELEKLPDPPAVCVTEVPLLYEVGGEVRFDHVVAVTAAPDVRVRRSMHVTPGRESRLLPDEEKLERADFAFVNDGSLDELDIFVSGVMKKLSA